MNNQEIEKLLAIEIPSILWDRESESFKGISLTKWNNGDRLMFTAPNGSTIIRNAGNIKWKWQGKQPIFNRITGKSLVFLASGVAEWLVLDWLGFDYIVLPSDSKKAAIAEFKDKLKDKAVIILPDHDESGSFQDVIDSVKSNFSYFFTADFYKDKDFRDYCRRVLSETDSFKDKETFVESLFYNIWVCAGGSEAKDDPVTENDLFNKIKEIFPAVFSSVGSDISTSLCLYDLTTKEYAIFEDKAIFYFNKDKILEYIKNIYFKDLSLKEASKNARNFLHKCPNYKVILDTTLPFGAYGDKFNIFEPTDVISYSASYRYNIDIEHIKNDFPYHYALLSNLFNTDEKLEYFINWLSYILNNPGKKTRNCIVLTGAQGTGKGLLYHHIIRPALGDKYCVELLSHNIRSNFTGLFHNKLFIVLDEMEKKATYDTLDKIKSYITDTDITIERKGVDSFTAQNKFNMMIFSNSTVPVKVEQSNRRFSVFKSNIPIKNVINDTNLLVEGLKSESSEFLRFIKSLKYSEKYAETLFTTPEGEVAKEGSLSEVELICNGLKERRFEELINDYPEATEILEEIRREIEEYNGFAFTSSIYSLFENIFGEQQAKKLKKKLLLYFGKAQQKRISNDERAFFYKIIDKDFSKTARQEQDKQMQYS